MKVGDLVIFQNCAEQGKAGIVTMLTKPTRVAKENHALQLYWVLHDAGIECFTGNQLRLA